MTANNTSGAEPNVDRTTIQGLMIRWAAAIRAKDATALAAMVTEDAVFLPPGFPPIRGKHSIEVMYKTFFPQFSRVELNSEVEELEVAGDWAFVWGSETMVLVPQSGGSPIEMQGRGMSILKRQLDGSWKIARGINNSALGSRL
ncbi:MAG TPA: SgcJ/EcaC family oxidoreductase [Vicinamibacterales bacterium]|jgi:uncharacterized protein (TIGR02246 family)